MRSQLDVHEAVLWWAYRNAETNLQPPAAYCLGYAEDQDIVEATSMEDPPAGLLERFGRSAIPVKPLSACRVIGGGEHAVVDRQTGGHSLLFGFGPATVAEGRAIARVGYVQGGEVGVGWECVLVRSSKRWEVERCGVISHLQP